MDKKIPQIRATCSMSFFGRDTLLKLLSQADYQGIHFYYGFDGEAQQLVAVGADARKMTNWAKIFM
ncbi:hypothetical protein [Hymenobacter terrenus]|uniref:hypothetical protein n=1 Tax=Hymenobacter terrenus TaxID=1629124 RepID=UPI0012E09883|nr:hypothetical protein [Hymenobacter terrenus]